MVFTLKTLDISVRIALLTASFIILSSIKEISCPKTDLLEKQLLLLIVFCLLQNQITILIEKPFLWLLFYLLLSDNNDKLYKRYLE